MLLSDMLFYPLTELSPEVKNRKRFIGFTKGEKHAFLNPVQFTV